MRALGMFWSPEYSSEQWVLFPWVQLHDNTYTTNNKGLAFFQVVGLNHLGMTFSCGFGLISNERDEGVNWFMEQVNRHRQKIGAAPPSITITDKDTAMEGVIRVYPEAEPQLCIWHINKNIKAEFSIECDNRAIGRV